MDGKKAGILFALAAMLTSAFLPVSSKFSLGYVNPFLFSSITLLFAFLASYLILIFKGRQQEVASALPRILKLAGFSYVGFSALFFIAQKSLTAVDSALLFQSEPFFAVLFSIIILSEKISIQRIAITALMVAVLVIFVIAPAGNSLLNPVAVLMLFASVAAMQFGYSISIKEISNIDPLALCSSASLASGLALFLMGAAINPSEMLLPSVWILPYLLFHGLVAWLISYLTYYEAIKRIGLSFSTAILIPAPVIAIVMAGVFLGESVSQKQILGLVIILACLAMLLLAGLKEKKQAQ